jgi:hypothetical protein
MFQLNPSLNIRLILDALGAYEMQCKAEGTPTSLWRAHLAREEIDRLNTPTPKRLNGGSHLAVVRDWMQRRAMGGEDLVWGSQDNVELIGETVSTMEQLAERIAVAAISDYRGGK